MNIFFATQNPVSKYNDEDGIRYDYPTRIPCGKQIKSGDLLIFIYSSKVTKRLKFGDKRIIGIGEIDNITLYNNFEIEMAIASYAWYKKLDPQISFDDIGGDIRSNVNNSINKIKVIEQVNLLKNIIKYL